MNRLYCLVCALSTCVSTHAQTTTYHLKYDHTALRIPGNKFAVTLVSPDKKQQSWSKYHVEVDSGRFSNGFIQLNKSSLFKKLDSVTVSVYTRKWFLGGKGKFLTSRRIPYDYEDSIAVITSGNSGLSPGDHLKFGIRTTYDDRQFSEVWYPAKKKARASFQ